MDPIGRDRWLWAGIVVGVAYLVVGLVFGSLAGQAGSHQMRVTWRLAAWVAGATAFVAHIGYEHLRLRSSPRTTAMHTSLSVALGALALAVAANVHAHVVAANNQRLLAVALVVWPVLAGLPAFILALAAASGLSFLRRIR